MVKDVVRFLRACFANPLQDAAFADSGRQRLTVLPGILYFIVGAHGKGFASPLRDLDSCAPTNVAEVQGGTMQ